MGQFKIAASTFTHLPDPMGCKPEPQEEVGRFPDGEPARQGPEKVVLSWPVLAYTEYDELKDRWAANDDATCSCDIPTLSGPTPATYRTVTAWVYEPQISRQQDINMYGVTMKMIIP